MTGVIEIALMSKSTGVKTEFHLVISDVKKLTPVSAHDLAGALFALEFAANNHSEIPMRVHVHMSECDRIVFSVIVIKQQHPFCNSSRHLVVY